MTDTGTQAAYAAWLGNRAVLLAGRLGLNGGPVDASVDIAGRDVSLDASAMPYGLDGRGGWLVIGHLPAGEDSGGQAATVTVNAAGESMSVDAPEFVIGAPGLRALVRNELSGLEAEQREQILEFILSATAGDLRGPGALSLARRLGRVREALREQLPRSVLSQEQPYAVHIDSIYAVDHDSVWVKGWLHDEDHMLESLVAVSPEGARADLLDGAYRHSRLDIEELYAAGGDIATERHGLIKFLSLNSSSRLREGWVAELRTATGVALEVEMPPVERSIDAVRAHLLGDINAERPGEDQLVREHVHPALTRIQARLEAAAKIDTVIDVGEGHATSPDVTVIVPLYKRIDFLEHQLAHFAHDPELGAVDLLYVLDSPEIADNLLDSAYALSALHGVPLRVAVMQQNAGFSGANNAAVSLARGRKLLLLNSDVIPDRPGWLGKMSAFYEATPNIGALGPKLLYEDDSLQHAGLYFLKDPGARVWGNQHYFKGMHRSFPAANVARAVPAVTAACMMIDRDLYEQAGGLSHAYVQGGYEDSDLCLHLIELGRQNWYMPGAELYHLEAQSYPSAFRKMATQYNMWLHTNTWNDRIAEVSKEYGLHPRAGKDSAVAEPSR